MIGDNDERYGGTPIVNGDRLHVSGTKWFGTSGAVIFGMTYFYNHLGNESFYQREEFLVDVSNYGYSGKNHALDGDIFVAGAPNEHQSAGQYEIWST